MTMPCAHNFSHDGGGGGGVFIGLGLTAGCVLKP